MNEPTRDYEFSNILGPRARNKSLRRINYTLIATLAMLVLSVLAWIWGQP